MITTPIFTRLLSTGEFGQYNVFNSWLSIVTIFVSLNLFYGVYTQALIKFDKERDSYTSSLQGLTLVLVACWTIIYLASHEFWNQLFSLTTVQMLAMLIMIWSSSVFNFWAGEQRVLLKYKVLVCITLLVSFAKPIIGIIFVLNADDKVTARILSLVLVELVCYTGLFIVQMYRGKIFYSKRFWRHALLFNLPLVPHYLSQIVLSSADRIMIGRMVGDESAGIYSLAYSLAQVMVLFNAALTQTLSPWIYQKIKDQKISDITGVAYGSLILIAMVNILLIAFAPEAVAVFAPKEYYDAKWIIPPVAMSVYFIFVYDLFAKFELFYEKTTLIMVASTVGAVLNVILNFLLIPILGYYVAGYITLVCYVLYAVFHYILMNRICQEKLSEQPFTGKILLRITLLFLGLGFVFLSTYNSLVLRYVFVFILCGIIMLKREWLILTFKQLLHTRTSEE
ncbi:lipopolysaccharide biosynthesis protein [Lactiplantibacillus modestisalitolerans]